MTGGRTARPVRKRRPMDVGGRLRGVAAGSIVLVLRAVVVVVSRFRGAHRQPDAFYDPPPGVPPAPGKLLRQGPHERGVPRGARGWRILYTTTRADGSPAVASALVLLPTPRPDGPLHAIAWAHGTTGVARQAAPSLLDDPLVQGAMPAVAEVVARGWTIVATDYIGLGTAVSILLIERGDV